MRIVVTCSSGHLGEGLAQTLRARRDEVVGLDLREGKETDLVGSISDREFISGALAGADSIAHTATLHKPHVATHSRHEFVETNIAGTLNLLEEAVSARVGSFVFTSTTSTFGRALVPPGGAPAAWIDESVRPEPKNIYGVTKLAAENLCELIHRLESLPCVILRTSRFFPDEDDRRAIREQYDDANVKANEYLYRRVDLADAVVTHVCAIERAGAIGFGRYIISATTPLSRSDLMSVREGLRDVIGKLYPKADEVYRRLGWKMFSGIDRVYVNERAREELDWVPQIDFGSIVDRIEGGGEILGPLAKRVGMKGYHDETFDEGPYPVVL